MNIFNYYYMIDGNYWGYWFRIFGRGLSFSTFPPLFSERNGYVKYITVFGVRIKLLRVGDETNKRRV